MKEIAASYDVVDGPNDEVRLMRDLWAKGCSFWRVLIGSTVQLIERYLGGGNSNICGNSNIFLFSPPNMGK